MVCISSENSHSLSFKILLLSILSNFSFWDSNQMDARHSHSVIFHVSQLYCVSLPFFHFVALGISSWDIYFSLILLLTVSHILISPSIEIFFPHFTKTLFIRISHISFKFYLNIMLSISSFIYISSFILMCIMPVVSCCIFPLAIAFCVCKHSVRSCSVFCT